MCRHPVKPLTGGLAGRGRKRQPRVRACSAVDVCRRPLVLAVLLLGATVVLAGCGGEPTAAGSRFQPVKPGVLTVATAFLPAPGFWEGRPPTAGVEAQFAGALAERLGLDGVEVVQVPFADVVHGRLHGADIALSQVTPTRDRDRFADF